jgi:two-component system response regulator
MTTVEPLQILLVEDDPGDVELTRESLSDSKLAINISVAGDGVEAMAFLRKEGEYSTAVTPDLILLDLNMPRKDGREVLAEIKADDSLKMIPVVILTTSSAETDIVKSYDLGANCYVTKPVGFDQFTKVVDAIEGFWFTVVKLPTKGQDGTKQN